MSEDPIGEPVDLAAFRAARGEDPPPPTSQDDYAPPQRRQAPPGDWNFGPSAPRGPPLPLIFYNDIQANSQTIDFVENLLVERSAGMIYGESNSGKTFFTADLALHVATGKSWRGKEVTQGGVVYFSLEGTQGFQNRVAAWRKEIGEDLQATFAAVTTSVDLLRPDADVPRVIAAIREAAQKFAIPVSLIVVDTLSRAMAGGNENAPDDMGTMVQHMDEIRAATGAAVLWIHHSGKDAARGARGHSLMRAALDTEIEISVEGSQRLARVSKQREIEGGQEFPFTLTTVELGTNQRGKPVTSCVVNHGTQIDITPKALHLSGNTKRAFDLLADLLAGQGVSGYAGTPPNTPSIPEKWWRDRFYDGAMPGSDQEAKQKAFRRAANDLLVKNIAAMRSGRIWLPKPPLPHQEHNRDTDDTSQS